MSGIKYGIKLRTSDARLMKDASRLVDDGIFHYVELLINPRQPDIVPFIQFNVEYVIHAPHDNYGVDISRREKKDFTLKMLDYSLKCADELGAKMVILHPGTGSPENAKEILSNYDGSRIVLENMPKKGLNGETCLGYKPDLLADLFKVNSSGLCLDFGHAMKAAVSLNEDYKKIISDFLSLNPRIFHVSDGDLATETDSHLNIGEGGYDLGYFIKSVMKSKSRLITLETPRSNASSLDDVKNKENLEALYKQPHKKKGKIAQVKKS